MACASPIILCATCEILGDGKKPKPGILLCIGCQKHFCSQHIVQHRQHLTDLIENKLTNERNVLHEKVSTCYEQQWSANIRIQMDTINKWELDTIELIKQSAEFARKHLQETALKECDNLQKQFAMLSDELITLCENGNYFENDIDQLTNKFQQFKHDIERFPVELSINEIPGELISVKSTVQPAVQPAPYTAPTCYFVDQLLTSKKPEKLIDLSAMQPGRMCPISDGLIAFYDGYRLPTLDIFKDSWHSLEQISGANELHWFNHLKLFLVLKYSGHVNLPNKLYQFDPYSGKSEEILIKSRGRKSSCDENFTTLTCFEKHVLIVLEKTIEKWSAHNSKWHTDEQPSDRWRPPISCHSCDKINCIRMNDRYYALIIERVLSEQGTSISVFYFELRNHGMSTLRRIQTDYDKSPYGMRLLSLPNESGWLVFFYGDNKKYCYVLDNDGKRYDQNTVLSSDVIDIAVQNNIILLRKIGESYDNDFVEVYDWQKLG